jgi:nitrate/nitrite transport system ATP-binding protein
MIARLDPHDHTTHATLKPGQAFLRIDHVDKSFTRGATTSHVLKDVDLSIGRGEYVSIIGHSGCGKSTLLNLIAGLTPVTSGAVLLEDKEVNAPGPERAVVFQNHSLLPWLTVYDNVRMGVDKVFGRLKSRAERHEWTLANLDLVQMSHAKDKRPAEISGGMKQDEVMKIHAKLGNTVIMITHDVDEAVLLSDRIVMMTNGPAARIGEVLSVNLDRPRARLDCVKNPEYLRCREAVMRFLYERHRFVEAAA